MQAKQIKLIPTWSISRVDLFERCKLHAYFRHGLKIPEPARPLPPGKTEHANDRGSRLHDNGELFARGKAKLSPELARFFAEEFEALNRRYHAKGDVILLEDEWGMTHEWEACKWDAPEVWLRLKLDALVFLSPTEAVVIDYKSGRREGNEIKHAEQMQLYQLVTFLRYPRLETVHIELWYVDIDDLHTQTYMRDQGLRFKKKFDQRGTALTTYEFTGDPNVEANPSIFSCRYCPYGPPSAAHPERTGHCKRGV
jgi:CRISPR/Cas system-associated exonuclease Cas4 (RecB family)